MSDTKRWLPTLPRLARADSFEEHFQRLRLLLALVLAYCMLASAAKGEISARFTEARFFFAYEGFEWLPYIGDAGIYLLYILLPLAALGIAAKSKKWARRSVGFFGLGFSYLHLIDSTNYINHYYLVSLLCLLLWLSLGEKEENNAYQWLRLMRWQIGLVYLFAGIAKINPDWLWQAQPLRIWLLQASSAPYWSWLGAYELAFFASWAAMFYDISIPFWLSWGRTRQAAYVAVLGFHGATWLLFDIGIFPLLMPVATLLFFLPPPTEKSPTDLYASARDWRMYFMGAYLCVQVYLPLRPYIWLSGDRLLYEEGYRWGWRVMLAEREGIANFRVCDLSDGRSFAVDNRQFLTPFQEKRLIQKAHAEQFGRYLGRLYAEKYRLKQPAVYVDLRVVLNGRRSLQLLDPKRNLLD